ncbi:MAG: hypothetical protein H0X66_07145 [Verrucomicrobia bacterium]|nr:hypothetical protein [Verrucomicrobiota bacterium]
MKSAYELAMERLNKSAPTVKLTEKQKKQLSDLDSKYQAKIAQREIAIKGEIATAQSAGDWAKAEELQQQLVIERKNLQSDLEEKKDKLRKG